MAKIKIQSVVPSNFGKSIFFGELLLKFDKVGITEVDSQEIADHLAANYPDWLYIDAAPTTTVKEVESSNVELHDEIARLKQEVEDRKATIKVTEDECAEWKNLVEKYKVQTEEMQTELEGFKIQSGKQIAELELKVQLTAKSKKDLIEFCHTLEIPAERFKDATSSELITIILDESRSK